jgi:excisionase family DNA binding protein
MPMGRLGSVLPYMSHLGSTQAKKAAAESQAAASRHLKLVNRTDFLLAKNIVELSDKCHYSPIKNLMQSGFTFERALSIECFYLYAVDTRIGPEFVGARRAARLIGVSRSQVQAMARAGELGTFCRERKRYRFYERDLLEWIVAQPTNPPEPMLWPPTDPERPRKPKRDA